MNEEIEEYKPSAADILAVQLHNLQMDFAKYREEVEAYKDTEKWRWARHTDLGKEQTLPVPRLEMFLDESLEPGGGYERMWVYRMVYRHFLGHCVAIPLGCTKQGGNFAGYPLREMMPFRDGAHMRHEMSQFGWPGFIIAGDLVEEIKEQ